MSVVFNGLTTIAGFGSLLVAHHRGVWSLGLLLVIGSVMTLTASLVVLPTLVRLADRRRSPAAYQDRLALWPSETTSPKPVRRLELGPAVSSFDAPRRD